MNGTTQHFGARCRLIAHRDFNQTRIPAIPTIGGRYSSRFPVISQVESKCCRGEPSL
jgi:hypothetical protein